MASFFNFASPVDVDVRLDGDESRRQVEVKVDKDRREKCPVYFDGESVKGQVVVRTRDGKKLVHEGIKIEFVGCIGEWGQRTAGELLRRPRFSHCMHAELFYDRGNHYEFLSLTHQLASPGEVPAGGSGAAFDFDFKNVEKAYESYNGINVKLRCVCTGIVLGAFRMHADRCPFCRYFIRVMLGRRMADVVKEKDIWVHSYRMPPDSNNAIKMEVGIEDCLHIEFEYNKSK